MSFYLHLRLVHRDRRAKFEESLSGLHLTFVVGDNLRGYLRSKESIETPTAALKIKETRLAIVDFYEPLRYVMILGSRERPLICGFVNCVLTNPFRFISPMLFGL